jgi:hypothetical protein
MDGDKSVGPTDTTTSPKDPILKENPEIEKAEKKQEEQRERENKKK